MINTINYIPKNIHIASLKPYEPVQTVIDILGYSDLHIEAEGDTDLITDIEETFICDTDLVIFSTANTPDESFLQFHIHDKEYNDFVIHHDIYVIPSINDASYININNNHFVALATFEKYVMIYDSLVFNPVAPQILLQGHDSAVMSIINVEDKFITGSEDKCLIEWDLEKLLPKKKDDVDCIVEKACLASSSLFYSEKNVIKSSLGTTWTVKGNIENMESYGNRILITTTDGYLTSYDVRNIEKPYYEHKYSEHAITGLDVLNNKIGLCTKYGQILILNGDDYEIKYNETIKSNLYSLKLHSDNLIFYGDDTTTLNMRKLKDNIL